MMTHFSCVFAGADFFLEEGDVCHRIYSEVTPQRGRSNVFTAVCPCAWLAFFSFLVKAAERDGK